MSIKRIRNHRLNLGLAVEALEDRRVLAAISGQVVNDMDGNGMIGDGESGIQGIHVFIDRDGNEQIDRNGIFIEPDDYAADEQLTVANSGILLSVANANNEIVPGSDANPAITRTISAKLDPQGWSSTGGHVFGYDEVTFFRNDIKLRMDFSPFVSSVSIDFTGSRPFAGETGMLELFDVNGTLIGQDTTSELLRGNSETLFAEAPNVAYAVAFTQQEAGGGTGRLDNLRVNSSRSELWTVTGPNGEYEFANLDEATFNVGIVTPTNWHKTFPIGDTQSVDVSVDPVFSDANFGLQTNRLNGSVFHDMGVVGTYEMETDTPIEGAIIYLDENSNRRLDRPLVNVEPDDFATGSIVTNRFDSIIISSTDSRDVPRDHVAAVDGQATTGSRVFGARDGSGYSSDQRLRVDFDNSVSSVSIDFISTNALGKGRIIAYTSSSEEPISIGSSLTLDAGQSETITVSTEQPQIDFVVIYADAVDGQENLLPSGNFDNLVVEGLPSEPVSVSDENGRFEHAPLEDSTYIVRQDLGRKQANSIPTNGVYRETISFGQSTQVNFGVIELSWQNQVNNLDVDNTGAVVPFDALHIINELNTPVYSDPETGLLPDPPNPVPLFYDVNSDGFVSPFDAILIINYLNENPAGRVAAVAAKTRSVVDSVRAAAILDLDDENESPRSVDDGTLSVLVENYVQKPALL